MRVTWLVGAFMLCQLHAGPAPAAGQLPQDSFEPVLLEAFRNVNPEIGRAAVLELQASVPGGPYVLIGWGIRADQRFRGDFRDELFGIFLVDQGRNRIERTLEILPTPRWLDYELRIESVTASEVVVVGKGATYGDGPIRREYSMKR